MPAPSSSLITLVCLAPVHLSVEDCAAGLLEVLAAVPGPRARRGVRHRLATVVAASVCAVVAGDRFWAVAIAPDGTWLASSGNDCTIHIWDAATARATRVLCGHTWTIMSIAIAPDGTWLASGSHDGSVRIWDVATGDSRTLPGHASPVLSVAVSPVLSVAVSPDGTWLATVGADPTVRIWEKATGCTTGVLHAHHDRVRCVTISPDGRRLASGSEDLTVRTWAVAAAPAVDAAWRAHRPVEHLAAGPDGTWLAAGYRGTVAIRSVATGDDIASIRGPHQSRGRVR